MLEKGISFIIKELIIIGPNPLVMEVGKKINLGINCSHMWSRYIVSELKSASCALELFYTYNIIPFLKPYRHLPTNKCLIGKKGPSAWMCLSHMDNRFSSYSIPNIFNNQHIGTIKDKGNACVVPATIQGILPTLSHLV